MKGDPPKYSNGYLAAEPKKRKHEANLSTGDRQPRDQDHQGCPNLIDRAHDCGRLIGNFQSCMGN